MKIKRISMITLGVGDLEKSTDFYSLVLETSANPDYSGVSFFELPGTWLALYPAAALARDISGETEFCGAGFRGVTLAHNATSREEVSAVLERARGAGASSVREAGETFWGGFSGYFADPDGHFWEVAWGPMFEFSENGELRFKQDG